MEVSPNSTTQPLNMYNYINNSFMNPIVFAGLALITIIIVLVSLSLGQNSNEASSDSENSVSNGTGNIFIIIAIIVFVVLLLINGVQYFFGVNIFASIKNVFSGTPEVDINLFKENDSQQANDLNSSSQASSSDSLSTDSLSTSIAEITGKKQVFNIPGNHYGYGDAKALCSAYSARLATYDELESAYNDGAEWCNYGWSADQMALYPTQKSTYNNLQKIKGHEHDCGRPGINGGYIANPLVKFGVNCFGHKPKINQEEQHLMDVTTPYPKTQADLALEQQVGYWKNKLDQILVSPFNYTSWSRV